MKIRLLFLIFITTFLSSCTETKNDILSLNGTDWQFKETTKRDFLNANVPGTVQTDLLKLGSIPGPFLLNNEDSIQWVSEKNWVYKKTFSVTAETLKKKHHFLKFEGLDTYAKVSLNDHVILNANNAFRTWEVDVSNLLKAENELKVIFKSTTDFENREAENLDYELPEAPRVFTRKPQFQYGWDWGPKIKTMGIYRDVSLVSYDNIQLKDVFIETLEISEEKATLLLNIEVETFKKGTFDIEIKNNATGESKFVRNLEFNEIATDKSLEIPLTIENPKLWWTHNLGEPFLYDFEISVKKGNTVIDAISKKVGLRTIELITKKDSIGESFYFKLNGKPVYMKGANYIPQNIFLPEVTKKQRNKLLNDAVEANMNMLRVWGGGVYEDDDFYELCDEKGILLWQDFMFACAMYPGDTTFLENIKQEAIDNVKRLRQHASIALWCGNNENIEGWHRWGWQDGKTEAQKTEIWNNYQKVFNDILPKVVDSLSPNISYWESSPKYGRGDKRYQFEGDAHDWWVWHDGYPFEHFEEEVPRFMSEFGFQSFPSYEAIQHFTQQDTINISHPSFTTHQKHSRGFQLIKEYMERDFPVPQNDADYVYVSQLLQAYGISKGIRAHRRAKPYNMGTLYWQLNDCWPVVSWSSMDGLGNWKALHYEAKRAFENRIIIPFEENNTLKIVIVEDSKSPLTADMVVLFKDFNGNIIAEYDKQYVSAFNEKNEVIFEIPLTELDFDPAQTYAEVEFGDTKAIHYFAKPKDLKLSADKPNISTPYVTEKGWEIRVSSKTLQKNVFLYSATQGHFSDNYFDVLPGETKTVYFFPKTEKPIKIEYKTLNEISFKSKIPPTPVDPRYNYLPIE